MKKGLCLIVCMAMLAGSIAAAHAAVTLDEDQALQYVLDEFKKIAAIPRPSSETDAISDYLYQWGLDHDFASVQDEVGNVIWDVPATPGYEAVALTALQAHMDMVCVSEEPGWDGVVTLILTEDGVLKADGTSMGGDDAIGIISAMYLATSGEVAHGPLRVILTINEEGGSPSGVGNLDHAVVEDAAYLVNIDSEDYGTVTVSACGFSGYVFSGELAWTDVDPAGKVAYAIDLNDLAGGHSGVDMHKNRANAIKAVDYCMAWAKYNGIQVQLSSFTGGTGMTAIPKVANAVIVFDAKDEALFAELMDKTIGLFGDQFDRTEAGYSFAYAPVDVPEKALSVEESAKLIDLVAAVEDGLNTVSQRYPGITETSFNVGTVSFTSDSDQMFFMVPMRLSSAWPALLANMQFTAIANAFGYTMSVSDDVNLGWVEKESDVIAEYYAQAFKEYTGEDCVITAVHGGLECADFAEWNDNLQIISVGPSVIGAHSTSEHIPVNTIVPTIGSIGTLLGYIAEGALE